MVILNTTYHVHGTIYRDFVQWLKSDMLPAADKAGMHSPRVSRVLGGDDPEGISLAFEVSAPDLISAKQWQKSDELQALHSRMLSTWGHKALFFCTLLDVIKQ